METVETEESDTDRSAKILNEIKHLTDRRNHITMTIRFDGTKKKFTIDTESPVTITAPDKGIIKGKKILPVTKKYQNVNKNGVKIAGKITVEAENGWIRKKITNA